MSEPQTINADYERGVRDCMVILNNASQDDRTNTIYDKMDDLLTKPTNTKP